MIRLCITACLLALIPTAQVSGAQDQATLRTILDRLENAERVEDQLDALSDVESTGVKSKEAIPKLTPYLQSASPLIRVKAAMALRAVGAERKIVRSLLKDKDPSVRSDLAWELMEADESPEDFLHMLEDPSAKVRAQVASSLLAHSVDPIRLRNLLEDPDGEVRSEVAVALIGAGDAPSNFLGLLNDPSPDVRAKVGTCCVRNGVDHKHLRPLLKDQDAGVRSSVGRALMEQNSEPVWECVLAWLDTPYKIEKYIAFTALGPKSRTTLAPYLFERLSSSDQKQRTRCIQALHALKEVPPEFHDQIVAMASSEHREVRRAAFLLARQLDGERLLATLRRGFGDSSVSVRSTAIKIARWKKCVELLPELTSLFEAESVGTRLAAAQAVAVLDRTDTRCVQVMVDALDPKDHKSMQRVCDALAFTGKRAVAAKDVVWQSMNPPKFAHSLFDTFARMDPPGLHVVDSVGEPALPWVRTWLADEDTSDKVKDRILTYLYFRGEHNQKLEPSLLKLLETTKSKRIHSSIISVLAKVGTTQPERLKPFTDGDFAREVPAILGQCHGDKKALEVAIDMLQDMMSHGDPRVRFAVCKALHEYSLVNVLGLDSLTEWIQDQNDAGDSLKSEAEMLERVGPKARPAMVELLKAIERGGGKTFPLNAVKAVGMDPIAELKSGLASEKSSYRHACAAAAAELKEPRLLPALIRALRAKRPVTRGMTEYRQSKAQDAVLHAIAAIGPTEDLIPELLEMIRSRKNTGAAARVLGVLGTQAKSALPTLMRHNFRSLNADEIEIAGAIARIQQSPIGFNGVKRCLRLGTKSPLHASPYFAYVIDLIVELEDRSKVLTEQLKKIVEGFELMHPESRIHSAYALAKLYPDQPQWRNFLESWKSQEKRAQQTSAIVLRGAATERLKQLDAALKR